jgi:hypothetical protein
MDATKQLGMNNEQSVADSDPEADDADILLDECLDADNTEDCDPEPEEGADEEEEEEYNCIKVMSALQNEG